MMTKSVNALALLILKEETVHLGLLAFSVVLIAL